MKIIIHILPLVVACMAGGIESSDSHDQGDNNGWHPSNAAVPNFSNHAGNGHILAGLSQDYHALSQGHEALVFPQSAQSFGHDASHGYDLSNHGQLNNFDIGSHSGQPSFAPSGHDLGHDASHGYDLSNHGQAKSFDIGRPSPSPSGHGLGGDSYLQAAHDFGNHDQGVYNAHAGDFTSQSGDDHADTSSHGGEGDGEKSNEQGDESHGNAGGSDGNSHTQAFILHDGGNEYGHGGQDAAVHDLGVQQLTGHEGQFGQGFEGGFGHAEPFTVGEHTDEQKPVEVPLYKHVTVPVQKIVHVNVPKPILIGIPHPYPVKVPVNKPVAVPVETEISIPIEKVVPYPVVKHVPYPVEKHVPYKVEKTIHVHVPQPYPVKVPIYKTIHHHKD